MQNTWRKAMTPLVAAIAIGAATPVLAADFGSRPYVSGPPLLEAPVGPFTLEQALAVASEIGVVTVSNTHFTGEQWEIEGRDSYGKWIEVDIDARTGEVRDVDRSIL
ncbi:PepSY domain-containing protein [Tardiphaga sp.]|uniref:PepSY domain-containing protein n=1 Tax=Tardiphaga sp. TaxID=1926292 RepID=UPI00261F9F80|nr:PepSY domain-containing protein [Tardiphaga sp.]MDB5620332.1 hypothetical protein [Tardiphaga sp.]